MQAMDATEKFYAGMLASLLLEMNYG